MIFAPPPLRGGDLVAKTGEVGGRGWMEALQPWLDSLGGSLSVGCCGRAALGVLPRQFLRIFGCLAVILLAISWTAWIAGRRAVADDYMKSCRSACSIRLGRIAILHASAVGCPSMLWIKPMPDKGATRRDNLFQSAAWPYSDTLEC